METESETYQGKFGYYTITQDDRKEVIIYRIGLAIAAFSVAAGILLFFLQGLTPIIDKIITLLFGFFILGLGVSLQTIHIYLKPLHDTLKIFWLIGSFSAIICSIYSQGNLINFINNQPLSLLGIAFIFASLTGIFIKEAFCFNRVESKILTLIIPILLLGYMINILPLILEEILLSIWGVLFLVFILNKTFQDINSDIGDKSVFDYLKNQRKIKATN